MSLRKNLIRLAHANPKLRRDLLPILVGGSLSRLAARKAQDPRDPVPPDLVSKVGGALFGIRDTAQAASQHNVYGDSVPGSENRKALATAAVAKMMVDRELSPEKIADYVYWSEYRDTLLSIKGRVASEQSPVPPALVEALRKALKKIEWLGRNDVLLGLSNVLVMQVTRQKAAEILKELVQSFPRDLNFGRMDAGKLSKYAYWSGYVGTMKALRKGSAGREASLRSKIIRLAHEKPELRPDLLPLLKGKAKGRTAAANTLTIVEDFLKNLWPKAQDMMAGGQDDYAADILEQILNAYKHAPGLNEYLIDLSDTSAATLWLPSVISELRSKEWDDEDSYDWAVNKMKYEVIPEWERVLRKYQWQKGYRAEELLKRTRTLLDTAARNTKLYNNVRKVLEQKGLDAAEDYLTNAEMRRLKRVRRR